MIAVRECACFDGGDGNGGTPTWKAGVTVAGEGVCVVSGLIGGIYLKPMAFQNATNSSLAKALGGPSATCLSVGEYSNVTVFSAIFSRQKWLAMPICLVRPCDRGSLDSATPPWLSP